MVGIGSLLGGAAAEADGEAAFVGLSPCWLVDTRGNGFTGDFGPPALAAALGRDFSLHGQCGIPDTALAVSLNVTATETAGPGFLLLFPQGGAQPLVSTLNYVAGETVANAALVPLVAAGAPETVRYHLLPALLLNELQRQERVAAQKDRELQAQAARLQRQEARLAEIAATVAELTAELARLKK